MKALPATTQKLPSAKTARVNFGRELLKDTDLIYVDSDFIDMFVDYLYNSGTNIYSYQISSPKYRATIYNRWFNSLPANLRQLNLPL